ncbi:hypothetical protein EsH8_IX_000258 [Colletotrichum jinshuiense]
MHLLHDNRLLFSAATSIEAWDLDSLTPASFNNLHEQKEDMLRSYLTNTKIPRALIIIPQQHSRGSLQITSGAFGILTTDLSTFPGFQQVVSSFTRDGSDGYISRPGAYFNQRSDGRFSNKRFEASFLLKYVARNHRKVTHMDLLDEIPQWSVRQQGIYQLHNTVNKTKISTTILINPSDVLCHQIKQNHGPSVSNQYKHEDWTSVITLAFESISANWTDYIACFNRAFERLKRDALATDPKRPNTGDADTQSLKAALEIMDKLQVASHVLESNIRTIRAVYKESEIRSSLWQHAQQLVEKERFANCVDTVTQDLEFQLSQVQSLMTRLNAVAAIVRDLVSLRNTHTMEKMTARTVLEAHTMRVIALLTLCFLPPTFIAGFLDMGYINITSAKGLIKVDVEPGLWLYLSISLPLVFFIMSAYLLWDRRNMRRANESNSRV